MRTATSPRSVTSLIEEFNYPKYGPGMMWEVATEKVVGRGRDPRLRPQGHPRSDHADGLATSVTAVDGNGVEHVYPCTHVISSMPIGAFCLSMEPRSTAPPAPRPGTCVTAIT